MLAAISALPHPANWYAGWSFILAGLFVGAILGLQFRREDFLGGYASWPRRLLRLGHIAAVALGFLNIMFSLAPVADCWSMAAASWALMLAAVLMPAVCFLAAFRPRFRHLFPLPVLALAIAVVCILIS